MAAGQHQANVKCPQEQEEIAFTCSTQVSSSSSGQPMKIKVEPVQRKKPLVDEKGVVQVEDSSDDEAEELLKESIACPPSKSSLPTVILSSDEDEEDCPELKRPAQKPNDKLKPKTFSSTVPTVTSVESHSCSLHRGNAESSCLECGKAASSRLAVRVADELENIDNWLKSLGKRRIAISPDGLCLPRSVFRAAKEQDLQAHIITFHQLLDNGIADIKKNWDYFQPYAPGIASAEEAMRDLIRYKETKKYRMPSSILDLVISALANVTSCNIIVFCADKTKQIFPPMNNRPIAELELFYQNAHYDAITSNTFFGGSSTVISDQNHAHITLTDSPVKLSSPVVKSEMVKQESSQSHKPNAPIMKESSIKPKSLVTAQKSTKTTYSAHFVTYRGKKKYVGPELWNECDVVKVGRVPDDIDGTCVYQVPIENDLTNCKGLRNWLGTQSSKSRNHTAGPRLIANCAGSYTCTNDHCPMVSDRGCVNRSDFKNNVCSYCMGPALYISCHARLTIEKFTSQGFSKVLHHGVHTCPVPVSGRPDSDNSQELMNLIEANPRKTRSELVNQMVRSYVEKGDISGASECAQSLTDTTYIDNLIRKERRKNRPDGNSFEALDKLAERWKENDPFYLFSIVESGEGEIMHVMKSSRGNVDLLYKLDKDGDHRLAQKTVHLDVLHSHAKGFQTYTLSYYDELLRSMVLLATMETETEDQFCCALFFRKINEMMAVYADEIGCPVKRFNPFHLKDDEHGGNKLGMAVVFSHAWVASNTSSCMYHFMLAVTNHSKLIHKDSQQHYINLCVKLKDAHSEDIFQQYEDKLRTLISLQLRCNQQGLINALDWWLECKVRWAHCYQDSIHQIPLNSLAEAAQSSLVAVGGKNRTLVDVAMDWMTRCIQLQAIIRNQERGERARGSGPSAAELHTREVRRQIDRAENFTEDMMDEMNATSGIDTLPTMANSPSLNSDFSNVGGISPLSSPVSPSNSFFDPRRSHRPDKEANRKRSCVAGQPRAETTKKRRSNATEAFKNIFHRYERLKCCVTHLNKKDHFFQVKLETNKRETKTVEIGLEVQCSCNGNIRVSRKVCAHSIWCLVKLCGREVTDPILAQVQLKDIEVQDLLSALPNQIPTEFTTMPSLRPRSFDEKLREHTKFNQINDLYIDVKQTGKNSMCSGCMKRDAIKTGDLHINTKGLLLVQVDKVVETTLRFCPRMSCLTNIKSSKHNVRPYTNDRFLKKSPLTQLTQQQIANVQLEGFTIENIPLITALTAQSMQS